MARLFGTDGVRGEANIDLTPELAYRLGRAATLYFGENELDAPTIIIGRDTRISGQMFEAALSAGICSAGGTAVIAGVIPTPAIAYLSKKHGASAGIVVSASHNPYRDNGIKFFGGDGFKLPDEIEDEIASLVTRIADRDEFNRANGSEIGTIKYEKGLTEEYIEYVLSTATTKLDGLKIVLDCANGAASKVMPEVLKRLGANVTVIHAEPDGININYNCGSTHMEMLQEEVIKQKADIGIAHDGDADRCLCVDNMGRIIDGDHILIICGTLLKKLGTLKKDTIVSTVMANVGFHRALKENDIKTEIVQVGDRYVLENMRANDYNLGGEQSGHVIFADFATTGDGLITALQVCCAMKETGKTSAELSRLMTSYPQLLINVVVLNKDGWEDDEEIKAAIEAGEKKLGDTGRILVRASGTEQLIRVMAEGEDEELLSEICNDIANVVRKNFA